MSPSEKDGAAIMAEQRQSIRRTFSWGVYALSSLSFLIIFGDFVVGVVTGFGFRHIPYKDVLIDILFYLPAGFAAVGVRNLFGNLMMSGAGALILAWVIADWNLRNTGVFAEGSGWLVYLYCIFGMVTAGCLVFYLVLRNPDWEDLFRNRR